MIFPGALGDLICAGAVIRAIGIRSGGLDLIARAELVRFAIGRMDVGGGTSIDAREIAALFAKDAPLAPSVRELFARYGRIHSFFASDNPVFRANLAAAAPQAEVRFHQFRPERGGHVAAAYLGAFYESIGLPSPPRESYRIKIGEPEMSAARAVLTGLGLEPGRYAVLFPGSGSPTKNWPLERYIGLARNLSDQIAPVFIPGPAEHKSVPILRASGITVISGLDLAEVAAISRLALIFVGNDSGVCHLAAAAGAPGVVLFGPTNPERWQPIGDVTVLRGDPIESLTVHEVARALRNRITDLKAGQG